MGVMGTVGKALKTAAVAVYKAAAWVVKGIGKVCLSIGMAAAAIAHVAWKGPGALAGAGPGEGGHEAPEVGGASGPSEEPEEPAHPQTGVPAVDAPEHDTPAEKAPDATKPHEASKPLEVLNTVLQELLSHGAHDQVGDLLKEAHQAVKDKANPAVAEATTKGLEALEVSHATSASSAVVVGAKGAAVSPSPGGHQPGSPAVTSR
jgi:hypothetical protein